MNDSDFLLFAEHLVVAAPGTLTLDDTLNDVGWDSLATLEFIAEADERSNVVVNAERLSACRTLRDVQAMLPASSVS